MKRIAILEPDDPKKELTKMVCIILNAVLKSKGLKNRERSRLEKLKLEMASDEIAEGITHFFKDFFETPEVTELILKGLGKHILAIRRKKREIKSNTRRQNAKS